MLQILNNKPLMERLQNLSVDSIAVLGADNQLEVAKEELFELEIEINRLVIPSDFSIADKEEFRIAAIQEMADVFQVLFHCWNVLVKDEFDKQIFLRKIDKNIETVQILINEKIAKDGE